MYTSFIKDEVLERPIADIANEVGKGINRQNLYDMLSDSLNVSLDSLDSFAFLAGASTIKDEINSIFANLDRNKDGSVTQNEVSEYLKKFYGISLETAIRNEWTVEDLTNFIEGVEDGNIPVENDNEYVGKPPKGDSLFVGLLTHLFKSCSGLFSTLGSLAGVDESRVESTRSAAESGSIGQMNAAAMADQRMHYFQP